jgi:hypothetical protein
VTRGVVERRDRNGVTLFSSARRGTTARRSGE